MIRRWWSVCFRGEISTTDLATQSMQGRGVHRFAMPDGAARAAEQIALRPDEPIPPHDRFQCPAPARAGG